MHILKKKSKIFLHLYNSTLFYFSIKKPFISPKNFFKKIKINRFFNVILKFGMYSVVKKGEKLGIDYIDLYNDGLPKPATNTVDEFYVDGVHPNDKGHLLIAEKIKKYLGL